MVTPLHALFCKTLSPYTRSVLDIHPHALIHGINSADIHAAFDTSANGAVVVDEDPPRWLIVGFDTAGRLLELVAIERTDGTYLAIHAMKARPATLRQLKQAREGR